MKRKRYTETQIIGILTEAEQGVPVTDLHGGAVRQHRVHPPFPRLVEVERLLDEQIDFGAGMGRAPQREDHQPLVVNPGVSDLGVGEVGEGYRGAGLVLQAFEGRYRRSCVCHIQIQNEIEIGGESEMTMEHDGDPTHDEVAHLGLVEGSEYRRKRVTGHAAIVA